VLALELLWAQHREDPLDIFPTLVGVFECLRGVVGVAYEIADNAGTFQSAGDTFGYVLRLIVAPAQELATMERYGYDHIHAIEKPSLGKSATEPLATLHSYTPTPRILKFVHSLAPTTTLGKGDECRSTLHGYLIAEVFEQRVESLGGVVCERGFGAAEGAKCALTLNEIATAGGTAARYE
jgi:hypothetical protein